MHLFLHYVSGISNILKMNNLTLLNLTTETVPDNATEADPYLQAIQDFEARATYHGDTAFVVISAALVFFMTPGLGYFYSGMARSKNALSLIFLCFLSMAVVLVQVRKFSVVFKCTLMI